jgi:hypothetical protein
LQRVADGGHHRHDNDQRGERPDAERLRHDQRDIGGEHDEIAMGDVDKPHHAEDQRQPGGKHRVKPANQHALHNDVDPFHQRRRNLALKPRRAVLSPPPARRWGGSANFTSVE